MGSSMNMEIDHTNENEQQLKKDTPGTARVQSEIHRFNSSPYLSVAPGLSELEDNS